MATSDAQQIALESARQTAESFGHMLASDLLAEARRRNPNVTMDFVQGETTIELVVTTGRGTVREARSPYERWHETFRRLGLL